MQYTIIDLIKLNDTLTKNLLQNPISEEEEEEHLDERPSDQMLEDLMSFNIIIFKKLSQFPFNEDCLNYRFSVINSLNEPPENNS